MAGVERGAVNATLEKANRFETSRKGKIGLDLKRKDTHSFNAEEKIEFFLE